MTTHRTAATAREALLAQLPPRVVVGANGAYWRDYGDFYSMCPVSDDNDPVEVVAVYTLAAAEAPGRVAAFAERWRGYARHHDGCIAQPPPVGSGEGCSCGLLVLAREYALAVSTILAAPASPAGEPGEGLPDASYLFRPAPTPSEPVERCGYVFLFDGETCGWTRERHVQGYHHPFTPATRDE